MIDSIDTQLFFEAIFFNALHNSIIIMDVDGNIVKVNKAFTLAFGYDDEDVKGKNFDMLFTEVDKKKNKPQIELDTVKKIRSANDENYLVSKNGRPLWVTGECIAVGKEEIQWLVKVIHNINAAKQLEKFLEEAEEFIESIFDSVKDIGLLVLDLSLKVVRTNDNFQQFFNLPAPPAVGEGVGKIHPFWNQPTVKECLRDILTKNKSLKDCKLQLEVEGQSYQFMLDSKMIVDNTMSDRQILVVVHKV